MVSPSLQLIDSQGHFNEDDLKSFLAETKFSDSGKSYSVVSIAGPQSSGKSTLLNHLCGTNFKVRDSFGQFQTTQGIWMAKFDRIQPFTIAMDIEGTDGRVKEGDTTFDKQSALFALEISDVVLINMWWHDLGRDEAACRPLLKVIFQFMVQLFKPHKTTLWFVLPDKTPQFSSKDAEDHLKHDIQKIWDGVPKPDARKEADLSVFFNVKVTALSPYHYNKNQFEQEVADMKQRFFSSASLGQAVAAAKRDVSASDFSDYANKVWELITQFPDLKTPNLQTMVAIVRCDAIIKEKLDRLSAAKVDKGILMGPREVAEKFFSIMETCFSEYDEETKYYDEDIRSAKREYLVSRAHAILLMRLSKSFTKAGKLKLAIDGASAAAQVTAALGGVVANSMAIGANCNSM